jgi:2-oxo-4-hydroxy-4-carboxy-5-ureidoimidazoline decarboxylase
VGKVVLNLNFLNGLDRKALYLELYKCCAASEYCEKLAEGAPYSTEDQLFSACENEWWGMPPTVWLEAFKGHPKIGDVDSLRKKYENTKSWTQNEQSGVSEASEKTLIELKELNDEYEKKFGFIFIVCATGKSADEMLAILKSRLPNDYDKELKIAAGEQLKITKLRLDKL